MKKIFIVFIFLSLICLFGCKKQNNNQTNKEATIVTKTPDKTATEPAVSTKTSTINPEPIEEIFPCELEEKYRGNYGLIYNNELTTIAIKESSIDFIHGDVITYELKTNKDNEIFFMNDNTKYVLKFGNNTVNITANGESHEYKKVFFIEYDFNGGTCTDYQEYFFFGEFITLPIPTNGDNEFLGWYEGETKIEAINENRDYSLKASYESWLPWI